MRFYARTPQSKVALVKAGVGAGNTEPSPRLDHRLHHIGDPCSIQPWEE